MSAPVWPGVDSSGRMLAAPDRLPAWVEPLELVRTCRTLLYAAVQSGDHTAALRAAAELEAAATRTRRAIEQVVLAAQVQP